MSGSLEKDALVSVRIDWPGLGNLGLFDTFDDPEAGSENTKYTPGGATTPISFGGRQTVDDGSVTRYFSVERDRPLMGALYAARGSARMYITKQPCDPQKNPVGPPIVFPGVLGSVKGPPVNSDSGNDVGVLTLGHWTEEPVA